MTFNINIIIIVCIVLISNLLNAQSEYLTEEEFRKEYQSIFDSLKILHNNLEDNINKKQNQTIHTSLEVFKASTNTLREFSALFSVSSSMLSVFFTGLILFFSVVGGLGFYQFTKLNSEQKRLNKELQRVKVQAKRQVETVTLLKKQANNRFNEIESLQTEIEEGKKAVEEGRTQIQQDLGVVQTAKQNVEKIKIELKDTKQTLVDATKKEVKSIKGAFLEFFWHDL